MFHDAYVFCVFWAFRFVPRFLMYRYHRSRHPYFCSRRPYHTGLKYLQFPAPCASYSSSFSFKSEVLHLFRTRRQFCREHHRRDRQPSPTRVFLSFVLQLSLVAVRHPSSLLSRNRNRGFRSQFKAELQLGMVFHHLKLHVDGPFKTLLVI